MTRNAEMDYKVLSYIDSPRDLKNLDRKELDLLCSEIRDLIIRTTSLRGGHLASSLGAVELAVAVLRVLDCPRDKVIWDVGHQAYAYKILTGRREQFETLRQHGGISGFPLREESEFDVVSSGHAGSSMSYGFGLALARELTGGDYKVAVVVGDGAMTSGVAYEAMNQVGHHLNSNLIVILNDNEMSISKNVGSMASYLSRFRLKPYYTRFKRTAEEVLTELPAVGSALLKVLKNLKDNVVRAILPGLLFEAFGLKYVGPGDGHNVLEVEEMIREASMIEGPVLLHLITTKGKGYTYSEEKPEKYHGVSPFDPESGNSIANSGSATFTGAFGEEIVRLGKGEEKIVAITAAMKSGTGLDSFSKYFPDRFFDVGIAEQLAVNLGAALAIAGFKPVVAIYSTFLQRAVDQLSQEICLQNLSVVLAVDRAGLVGEDGVTHHGYFDITYLRMLPNMVVMAPATCSELKAMLEFALRRDGPSAIRFPRGAAPEIEGVISDDITLGRGEVISEGKDVCVIALGEMVSLGLEVASELKSMGLEVSVVNARFAKPIDVGFLREVTEGKSLLVTLEDNVVAGGFGSAVLEKISSEKLGIETISFGLPDRYIEHGTRGELFREVGLEPKHIAREITKRLERER